MTEFIQTQGGLIATILFVAMALNALLSGVSAFLDFIKDKTPTDIDNKAAVVVHKILDAIKWAIDFLSANRAHP